MAKVAEQITPEDLMVKVLGDYPYRGLQVMVKARGLKATGSKANLIKRYAEDRKKK